MTSNHLAADRFFSSDPAQKRIALELYTETKSLPLVCPHGHVDPRLFADHDYSFGTPTELLIIPDHYVFRMLYSQGISLESLGIPRVDGGEVEQDHRKIWGIFGKNFHLFHGTPSGAWLNYELKEVFGIEEKLNANSADRIYDEISEKLDSPEFRPRHLFNQFNIEVLCTTDGVTDSLDQHKAIRASAWNGRVIPTYRPDALVNIELPSWPQNVAALGKIVGQDIGSYQQYILALENRRAFFRELGAKASDHGVTTPYTTELSGTEAELIFQKALKGKASSDDAFRFTGHMLMEMARMAVDDGMTMQIHAGIFRNHNKAIFERFGADKGGDIPISCEFTKNLRPLLNKFGNDCRFRVILFTIDETTYARELAPLAGHYPAVKLGPPWWFVDSLNGMTRYFDSVMETAGIYNTAGFNDDTRAFCSIPARHDVWRRASANWISGLVVRGLVDRSEASEMIRALAYDLAKTAYRL